MKLPQPLKDNIISAARTINYYCDGAKELDGVGFNSTDTYFFKGKLHKADRLTTNELMEMYQRLRKYKGQLKNNGIDYERLLFINER